uniref:Barwin-like endoglucanase n=1 Tax=Cynara cardunculus var. scolymus TaxID=59895 RepID=A0A103XI24_CYNCS
MKQSPIIFPILFCILITLFLSSTEAQSCNSNEKLAGKNSLLGRLNDSDRCKNGKFSVASKGSPLVVGNTNSIMTINSFEKGGDGGQPSECDGKYHSDDTLIVALSSKWYNHGQRCFKLINIYYNDKSMQATVVDECDSNKGCRDDIVDASKAVWKALEVPKDEFGETTVTWSDA